MDMNKLEVFAPTVGAFSWGAAVITPKVLELTGITWNLETVHITALTAVIAGALTFSFKLLGYRPGTKPTTQE